MRLLEEHAGTAVLRSEIELRLKMGQPVISAFCAEGKDSFARDAFVQAMAESVVVTSGREEFEQLLSSAGVAVSWQWPTLPWPASTEIKQNCYTYTLLLLVFRNIGVPSERYMFIDSFCILQEIEALRQFLAYIPTIYRVASRCAYAPRTFSPEGNEAENMQSYYKYVSTPGFADRATKVLGRIPTMIRSIEQELVSRSGGWRSGIADQTDGAAEFCNYTALIASFFAVSKKDVHVFSIIAAIPPAAFLTTLANMYSYGETKMFETISGAYSKLIDNPYMHDPSYFCRIWTATERCSVEAGNTGRELATSDWMKQLVAMGLQHAHHFSDGQDYVGLWEEMLAFYDDPVTREERLELLEGSLSIFKRIVAEIGKATTPHVDPLRLLQIIGEVTFNLTIGRCLCFHDATTYGKLIVHLKGLFTPQTYRNISRLTSAVIDIYNLLWFELYRQSDQHRWSLLVLLLEPHMSEATVAADKLIVVANTFLNAALRHDQSALAERELWRFFAMEPVADFRSICKVLAAGMNITPSASEFSSETVGVVSKPFVVNNCSNGNRVNVMQAMCTKTKRVGVLAVELHIHKSIVSGRALSTVQHAITSDFARQHNGVNAPKETGTFWRDLQR